MNRHGRIRLGLLLACLLSVAHWMVLRERGGALLGMSKRRKLSSRNAGKIGGRRMLDQKARRRSRGQQMQMQQKRTRRHRIGAIPHENSNERIIPVCRNDKWKDVRKLAVDKKISWKSFLKKCQMKLRMKCIRVFELSGREIDMQTERVVSDDRAANVHSVSLPNHHILSKCRAFWCCRRERVSNRPNYQRWTHKKLAMKLKGAGKKALSSVSESSMTHAVIIQLDGKEILSKIAAFRRKLQESADITTTKSIVPLSSLHIPLVAIRSDRESLSKILVALKAFENSSVKEIISKSLLPYVMISMQGASLSDNGRDVIIGVRNDRHMEVLCDLQRALYAHLMHNCPNMIVPVKSWLPYCVAVRMRNFHPHSKIRQNITRFVVYNRRESFGSMACCSLKLVNVRQRDAKDGCFKVLSSVELAKPPQEKELCSLMKSLNVASKRFEDTAQKVADNAENNGAHYLDLVADVDKLSFN